MKIKPDSPNVQPVEPIQPMAAYTLPEAQRLLHLGESSLKREIRQRRLRFADRCGKYYILGEWLIEWIRAGEMSGRDDAE